MFVVSLLALACFVADRWKAKSKTRVRGTGDDGMYGWWRKRGDKVHIHVLLSPFRLQLMTRTSWGTGGPAMALLLSVAAAVAAAAEEVRMSGWRIGNAGRYLFGVRAWCPLLRKRCCCGARWCWQYK